MILPTRERIAAYRSPDEVVEAIREELRTLRKGPPEKFAPTRSGVAWPLGGLRVYLSGLPQAPDEQARLIEAIREALQGDERRITFPVKEVRVIPTASCILVLGDYTRIGQMHPS